MAYVPSILIFAITLNWSFLIKRLSQYTLTKIVIRKDICTPMFTAVLFMIAKAWKQPKCISKNEWIWKKGYNGIFSSVQSLRRVQLFVTPRTEIYQASLSIINSQSLLRLISIESVMPSNHLILCYPFSPCLQSFPASGSFPMSQFFASGGESIGVSALTSVLLMNIQD